MNGTRGRYARSVWQRIVRSIEAIRPVYDSVNKAISLGLELVARHWSYQALAPCTGKPILDVGAGPGTSTRALVRHLEPQYIVALDPSPSLVAHACSGIDAVCDRVNAVAEHLPLRPGSVCAATAYFAARDFMDLARGLYEMMRVSRRLVVITDIFVPDEPVYSHVLRFWTCRIVPLIALVWGPRYASHYRMLCPTLDGWRSAGYIAELARRMGGRARVRLVPGGAVGVVAVQH